MKTCIYLLKNKINNKVYIGQASNFKRRLGGYKSFAKHNNHSSKRPINRAINKYGWNNFDIIILEECQREQLNEREIYWINFYKSTDHLKGYNISPGGNVFSDIYCGKNNPFYGHNHSLKTRNHLSELAKERFQDKNNHPLFGKHHKQTTIEKLKKIDRSYIKIPVLQLDKITGMLIKEWPSAREAAIGLGHKKERGSNITIVCNKYFYNGYTTHTALGYKWEYKNKKPSTEEGCDYSNK